nr:immunoglobulin heavy chain junction region [Macaca mulatta]MOW97546.1 immunoglobulin heavy chain junction region [Macaca mulatta]MOW97611.1 immunoglobulin heavy chain junction region [Macaca mulatta]
CVRGVCYGNVCFSVGYSFDFW